MPTWARRQIREILRLRRACGLPQRAVARGCGVGLGTVFEYCRRAAQAGLTWPLPDELDDRQLEARTFRRLDAPELAADVAEAVTYTNRVCVKPSLATADEKTVA